MNESCNTDQNLDAFSRSMIYFPLQLLKRTSLFFQQVFFLVVVPQLWRFDLCGDLWVDVVAVADVVHAAAATRDDPLHLLSLVHLGWLVPI